MKKLLAPKRLILIALIFLGLVSLFFLARGNKGTPEDTKEDVKKINSFAECIKAGNPVMESYPRRCRADSQTFTEDIGNELAKADLVRVENPRPNQTIGNSLLIKGTARGAWYFEASFPIFLYDGNGQKIATAIAQAKADWMTGDFVPFEAVLRVPVPDTAAGVLVFKKDNPSGLPANEDELRMPINFSSETREISLYFYNQKRDKEIADYMPCSADAVLPVTRKVFLSQTPIQDAINLLLQGNITPAEKEAGFVSEFPLDGIKLVGANLKDGVLTLEFADPLGKTGGGSCRVGLLWGQIAKTAKQFAGVKEVRFSPEDLFQP